MGYHCRHLEKLVSAVGLLLLLVYESPAKNSVLRDPVRILASTFHRAPGALQQLSPHFEVNRGQTDRRVAFLSRASGFNLFLTSDEAVLVLKNQAQGSVKGRQRGKVATSVLRMKFVGGNPAPRILGLEELPGRSHYFLGNKPAEWRTNIPHFAKVRYEAVYPGVDVVYFGRQGELEYDIVLGPGASLENIQLVFEGATAVRIDGQQDLIVSTPAGDLRQPRPQVYQQINGVKRRIAAGYVLRGSHQVGFQVGRFAPDSPLVIDPVLIYSRTMGGSADNAGIGVAVDPLGNVYVTGWTESMDFPLANPSQGTLMGVRDAFVSKLDATGSTLIYSTYLGGDDVDEALSIAADASGSATVVGETASTDFPTVRPLQPAFGGGNSDGFIVKLAPAGSVIYSTYIGGNGDESVNGIALDNSGYAFITGPTSSSNFPVTGALQPVLRGFQNAFIGKLKPDGSAFLYSTYLGGTSYDEAVDIAVDSAGSACVTGITQSPDFPLANALQPVFGGGISDAFVTKLSPTGSTLVFSTFLGGSGNEDGFATATDIFGNVYVTGWTDSADFPVMNAVQPVYGGGLSDVFVTKYNPVGSALIYSTYLGGSGADEAGGIAVDTAGDAHVAGSTDSDDFPVSNPLQPDFGGGDSDAIVFKLTATGLSLVYSTYLGTAGSENAVRITVDPAGNAYVVGTAVSPDLSMPSSRLQTASGTVNIYVAKIAP